MKKNILATIVVAVVSVSMSQVFAAAGTVNFNGNILDSACDVDVGSQNQVVTLGDFYKFDFPVAGARAAARPFQIVLKNCPPGVNAAQVRFDGTPDQSNPNLLAIDNSSLNAATGVAINLMSADKTDLPLHGSNGTTYLLSSTQDNALNFYAQYQSTAAAVTAGTANAVANFSVVYN
ncbi:fimbrial protein [Huaxiibacter chinensis]